MVQFAHSRRVVSTRMAPVTRFEVHADRCPQAVAKIVGTFASQDMLPRDLRMRQSCAGVWLAIEIDLDAPLAERLAERLRALVPVWAVVMIRSGEAAPAPHAEAVCEPVMAPVRELAFAL